MSVKKKDKRFSVFLFIFCFSANLTCVSFEHTTNSSALPVPEPYVREPTDFIPDSEDTSAATSREVTQANISKNNDTKAQQRPKVVSLVCRAHEGKLSTAPYSIKPTQLVSLKYLILGRVAQSITCLATDLSLIADVGVPSLFTARSHTFVKIDHEIILQSSSSLPLNHSRRVVVSHKRKYVHKILVNRLFKHAQEKSVVL